MIFRIFKLALTSLILTSTVWAQSGVTEPILGAGDAIKVTVFQNPDLSIDTRITEVGQISFPLVGNITLAGLSVTAAQDKIAKLLRDGGYIVKPQVSIALTQVKSIQISILGQVTRPGRYPIETTSTRVSEMIAVAGGVLPGGSDVITLSGVRNGKPVKYDIDLPSILQAGQRELDLIVMNGDTLYVDREQKIFIDGEVQRPGAYRWDRGMTLRQVIAQAGGLTNRGTERGMHIYRRDIHGGTKIIEPLTTGDPVERDDVIKVRESVF